MRREHLADLNAFLAVAEEGSFTRAAAKMGTSQSALSHTISRLEARLGVRLLSRTTRNLSPTEAGERLIGTLRPAFDDIDAGLSAIQELRDKPSGTIRITATQHSTEALLWPRLREFLPAYPDIHVEISVDEGFTDIVSDRFDAGIRIGESIAKDMIAVRIGPDLRLLTVASPDYLATYGVPQTPHDLAAHECINMRFQTKGSIYAWEFEKDGREMNVRVNGRLTFNDIRFNLQAAVDGFGIAFAMEDVARPLLEAGKLVSVLEDWCAPFPGYHLYYPSRREHGAAFALLVEALRYPRRRR
ncbi:MAG TPA: LysR family transcriptional regulator [Sphingobium sp.]|uniref:LysR family transcriptional regulator n=1 Tax=Sphingobium sp. TaxID=1912891 RepID=UPI002ED31A11